MCSVPPSDAAGDAAMGSTVGSKFTGMTTRGMQRAAATAATAAPAGGSAEALLAMAAAASASEVTAATTRGVKRPHAASAASAAASGSGAAAATIMGIEPEAASLTAGGAKRKSGTRAPLGSKLGRPPDSERDELEHLPCGESLFNCFIGQLAFKVGYSYLQT